MKPEDQIIAIAAACGWHPDPVWASVRTPTHCVFKKGDELRTTKELPDWLNDLNAIHEAIRELFDTNAKQEHFMDKLYYVTIAPVGVEFGFATLDENLTRWVFITASAKQLCEATVRALVQWRYE